MSDGLEKTIYVAPDGDDTHPGTEALPLRTLAAARDRVRSGLADGQAGPRKVLLRGGVYELTGSVRFDERDAGTASRPVVYVNYPGETPRLIGGRRLDGWTRHAGSIYKTQLPHDRQFYTLFEQGERCAMARFPAGRYLTVAAGVEGAELNSFAFRPGDLPEGFDYADAQVYIWPGEGEWNWLSQTAPIARIDWDACVVTMAFDAPWKIGAGSRYYIQGAMALLREPGQFYLNEAESTLYYKPRRLPIAEREIVAPTTVRVLDIRGSSGDNPVSHLHFRGLHVAIGDFAKAYRMPDNNAERDEARHGLIHLENAEHIRIEGCRVEDAGFSGIALNRYAQHNAVYGNDIARCGFNGVYLIGPPIGDSAYRSPDEAYVNKFNAISNNRIADGGLLIGHGSGIQLYQSGDNAITHNEVLRMSRYGISLKGWYWKYFPDELYGVPIRREIVPDYLHTRNNRIACNDVYETMLDSQDGGIIEAWSSGLGNVIHHNRFHHTTIRFSYGYALYLDDAAGGFTVTSNLVHDLDNAPGARWEYAVFSKGAGNTIRNNIVAMNRTSDGGLGLQLEDWAVGGGEATVERNIFYRTGETARHADNWYADEADWFVDPERGDFTLREEALPALQGFEAIEPERIGLRANFPFPR